MKRGRNWLGYLNILLLHVVSPFCIAFLLAGVPIVYTNRDLWTVGVIFIIYGSIVCSIFGTALTAGNGPAKQIPGEAYHRYLKRIAGREEGITLLIASSTFLSFAVGMYLGFYYPLSTIIHF